MDENTKGASPFYPNHPVPVELFTGRAVEIKRIVRQGIQQVVAGKPINIYVQGDYGIGKSSIANYTKSIAEREYGMKGVYVSLSGCKTVQDVAANVLRASVEAGAKEQRKNAEIVSGWVRDYISEVNLFGVVKLKPGEIAKDAPSLADAHSMIAFLGDLRSKFGSSAENGLFLILDEINGIAADAAFCQLLKGMADVNGMADPPVPLLLMVCGTEDRRREMILSHQSVDRIFDIVPITPMSKDDVGAFFTRAFDRVNVTVEADAMEWLLKYAAGLPKIMHIIGDNAYFVNEDDVISRADAVQAVVRSAHEVGAKFVDAQVLAALRSDAYRSILRKVAALGPSVREFSRAELAKDCTQDEAKKLDNFLRKMVRLNVIGRGENQGQYYFRLTLVRIYIWLSGNDESLIATE